MGISTCQHFTRLEMVTIIEILVIKSISTYFKIKLTFQRSKSYYWKLRTMWWFVFEEEKRGST